MQYIRFIQWLSLWSEMWKCAYKVFWEYNALMGLAFSAGPLWDNEQGNNQLLAM